MNTVSDETQALGSGRPPAMELNHTDCQLPNDPNERTAHSGRVTNRSCMLYSLTCHISLTLPSSVYNWKHHFTKDCLWPVIEQNFNLSKSFSYSQVLAVDRKIREFDFGSLERESLMPRLNARDQVHASNGAGEGGLLERWKKPNPNLGLLMQRWINKNCKDHG